MSLVDNLPPVIKRVEKVLNGVVRIVEEKEEVKQEVKEEEPRADDGKPFILVCSRELKPEEMIDLQGYGKVLVWRDSYLNIPLREHVFDYCLVDIHNKLHRQMLMKEDLKAYHLVCVVGYLDAHDDFIEDTNAENSVRSLPDHQAKKSDFDRLLLANKLKKPNLLKSCLRAFLRVLAGWPKE
jgi:hypothetical protein